jgi:hypothetical protein
VEGGGIIVLLLSNLNSLTQLYQLTMDMHGRLRTDSHQDVTGARLAGSLAGRCQSRRRRRRRRPRP